MPEVPEGGARPRPHVVVVGNHKGGSGKSTVAMHLIVALLKAGKRVASFDLDVNQQTLTHYIGNRWEWAQQHNLPLELPDHCSIADDLTDRTERDESTDLAWFTTQLAATERYGRCDFVVIDTPGGVQHLSLVAHAMADTLVTPINDSLVDLDVIVAVGASKAAEPQPSRYARTVARALDGRRLVSGRPTDWIVLRNRLAPLGSHHQRQVAELLEAVHARLGFRTARGLSERLVFREFFAQGLTALDRMERTVLGARPGATNLVARLEVRDLVEQIGLLPKEPSTEPSIQPSADQPAIGADGNPAGAESRVEAPSAPARPAKRRRKAMELHAGTGRAR
ncbi:MAG TPA: division plane positioning ATPase MipZ [Xanthobacteraceae bacterium]|nr:division plane positioning ATPase MipZ [Xanthobacteraceae bacterium]